MHRPLPARFHVKILKNRLLDFRFPFSFSHLCNHTKTSKPAYGTDEELPTPEATITSSASSSTALISHPWQEWVDLLETLSREGYLEGNGGDHFRNRVLRPKDSNSIRTACLNFARDRRQIIENLSSKHIRVIIECGCPSVDRKVVNSGKRLRAHLGLVEGNVCGSCNLRGKCERAFVEARENVQGRTIDVMRILLTYSFDPIFSNVENKRCLNIRVEDSVRHLLKQMLDFCSNSPASHSPKQTTSVGPLVHQNSQGKHQIDGPMKPGDWRCVKCDFINFSRNIKCLHCDSPNVQKLRQIREEQEHFPLKKGDWICDKCTLLNFARNTRCWQCEAKPPERQLNPGEWECESCNYINFRRNAICLKCNHRRPKSLNTSNVSMQNVDGKERMNVAGDKVPSRSTLRRQVRHEDPKVWRFVDTDEEIEMREQLSSVDEASPRFIDFPIVGGRSDLSHDIQKREEWKLNVVERKKRKAARQLESLNGCEIPVKSETAEHYYEDEEMANWFH